MSDPLGTTTSSTPGVHRKADSMRGSADSSVTRTRNDVGRASGDVSAKRAGSSAKIRSNSS